MTINQHIFREYDIRGLAASDLPSDVARAIGQAYGTVLRRAGGRRFALGRDCRVHSDRIAEAFAAGAMAAGVDIVDIGQVPTPVMYYALFALEVDGGVVVTASHNPAPYNGFKVCVGREALHGDQIRELGQIAAQGAFASGAGSLSVETGLVDRYVAEVKSAGAGLSGFSMVMDAGNGMASLVAPRIFEELGARLVKLYCELDGTFPNHEADPTQEATLKDLIATLAKTAGAKVGIAYDGDADRVGAVDPDGTIVWGDRLLILFARDVLRSGPATIICDVKCTGLLEGDVARHGGKLVMWKTGHSLIKSKLKEEHAALAGEMSGHMFFADRYYGYDDAIYASVRLANILAREKKTMTELLSDLPHRVSTPELRVACPEERKFAVVEGMGKALEGRFALNRLDGVRFSTPTGWGLVRASNTQPVLVLRFEAEGRAELDSLQDAARSELKRLGVEG